MSFTVIIPARYQSTRLPGKPLLDILGKTMIQRVYEQARKSGCHRVIVATDDKRVFNEVKRFGGEVTMTAVTHVSGTDRIQEVAELEDLPDDEIVVNVQGDEPLIPPTAINQVAENLVKNSCFMSTLYERILSAKELFDPNVVKLVTNNSGMALYFSRAPIPWDRDVFNQEPKVLSQALDYKRHIGIYAYRVSALNQFVQWPVAAIEDVEKLEQLRIMAEGESIFVDEAIEAFPAGIDTSEDLRRTIDYLEK
jgi:3-deoxy-manno-octulosonate cytidylyltransferase (CMP-KDO synthetase)